MKGASCHGLRATTREAQIVEKLPEELKGGTSTAEEIEAEPDARGTR